MINGYIWGVLIDSILIFIPVDIEVRSMFLKYVFEHLVFVYFIK